MNRGPACSLGNGTNGEVLCTNEPGPACSLDNGTNDNVLNEHSESTRRCTRHALACSLDDRGTNGRSSTRASRPCLQLGRSAREEQYAIPPAARASGPLAAKAISTNSTVHVLEPRLPPQGRDQDEDEPPLRPIGRARPHNPQPPRTSNQRNAKAVNQLRSVRARVSTRTYAHAYATHTVNTRTTVARIKGGRNGDQRESLTPLYQPWKTVQEAIRSVPNKLHT